MSQVRMCDKCGEVFSELEDGFQSFTAVTMKRDPKTGEMREIRQAMDACPACAIIPRQQFDAELVESQDAKELESRIARLERQRAAPIQGPSGERRSRQNDPAGDEGSDAVRCNT